MTLRVRIDVVNGRYWDTSSEVGEIMIYNRGPVDHDEPYDPLGEHHYDWELEFPDVGRVATGRLTHRRRDGAFALVQAVLDYTKRAIW